MFINKGVNLCKVEYFLVKTKSLKLMAWFNIPNLKYYKLTRYVCVFSAQNNNFARKNKTKTIIKSHI